jgi:hypothetical protein
VTTDELEARVRQVIEGHVPLFVMDESEQEEIFATLRLLAAVVEAARDAWAFFGDDYEVRLAPLRAALDAVRA